MSSKSRSLPPPIDKSWIRTWRATFEDSYLLLKRRKCVAYVERGQSVLCTVNHAAVTPMLICIRRAPDLKQWPPPAPPPLIPASQAKPPASGVGTRKTCPELPPTVMKNKHVKIPAQDEILFTGLSSGSRIVRGCVQETWNIWRHKVSAQGSHGPFAPPPPSYPHLDLTRLIRSSNLYWSFSSAVPMTSSSTKSNKTSN